MLTVEQNEELTKVGPGTPMGVECCGFVKDVMAKARVPCPTPQ